ncbi:MAG: hypothetical protein J6A41_08170 [Ruminiclostridium sp.]|nr:hypothetical protein [Ruminiclostridium sp.]
MNSDGCSTLNVPQLKNAAVITPCGMLIEPYGEHKFSEIKAAYSAQAQKNSEASAFILKGMVMLSDLRAALLACRKTGKPVYAELMIDEELRTTAELPADAALITLQSMGLSGFGVKSSDEENTVAAVKRLVQFADIPVFARISEASADEIAASDINISTIEDYCVFSITKEEKETAIMLSNEREAFFLEPDTTELSEPIPCEANMDEILCDLSQENFDVLRIEINTPDDAVAFTENAHMATLPVMFTCEDDISVMLALMLYQGRALIDSTCTLDEETLKKATTKYGAVIY